MAKFAVEASLWAEERAEDLTRERMAKIADWSGSPSPSGASVLQRFVSDVGERLAAGGVIDRVESVSSREQAIDILRLRTTLTDPSTFQPISKDSVQAPDPSLDALNLFRVVPVLSDDVQAATEGARTSAAAPTAYGTSAPEANAAFTRVLVSTKPVRVSDTVTKSAFADGTVPEAIEYLTRDDLNAVLETQALVGNGVGDNWTGVLTAAGIQTQARATDPRITAIIKAAGKIRATTNRNFGRDGIDVVLNPADALTVALETATGSGEYALNEAAASLALLHVRSFRLSPYLTAGTALVGNFSRATIYLRTGLTLSASDSHLDYFTRGLLSLVAEIRAGFVTNYPSAFCTVTGM
jgi:hypothetical protein